MLANAGLPAPKFGTGHQLRAGPRNRRRHRLSGAGAARPTCSAGAAWRSSTTRSPCTGYITRATELSPEHPVLVDRFLEDAIEIDVDALCDGTEVYIGGDHGAHRGGRYPLRRLGLRAAARHAGPQRHRGGAPRHRGARARRRRRGPAQRAVRAEGRRALRARGQPAGQPHRAVRLQGHRDSAGQGLCPGHAGRQYRPAARGGYAGPHRRRRRTLRGERADRGQGGGAAVQPVPQGGRRRASIRCSVRR